eukprot:42288-Amphidinium_carterae.1
MQCNRDEGLASCAQLEQRECVMLGLKSDHQLHKWYTTHKAWDMVSSSLVSRLCCLPQPQEARVAR